MKTANVVNIKSGTTFALLGGDSNYGAKNGVFGYAMNGFVDGSRGLFGANVTLGYPRVTYAYILY